ncbi:MAG: ComEC/Rec2 family competence protein [Treponema sp.]|nr:ComEC/Rec2 family competence protein [Treponema sp.]
MVRNRVYNPIVLAACICVLLLYCVPGSPKSTSAFRTLVARHDVCAITGKIVSTPQKQGERYAFSLEPWSASGASGATSAASGVLTVFMPQAPVEAHFPGRLYTAARNSIFSCDSGAIVTVTGTLTDSDTFFATRGETLGWEKGFSGYSARFRTRCRLQFRRLLYAWGHAGGLLLSLFSGAREYTELETIVGFRNAGLSHILALSGMHLSLVSLAAFAAGQRLAGKKYAFLLQAAAVVLFVWFAGASPSLTRALLCSLLMLGAALAGGTAPDMVVILAVSFLCHACIAPQDVHTAAFVLSYGALAGILTIGRHSDQFLSRWLPPPVASGLAASIGAQLFTAPISLALFGSYMPIGIVATLIVSPLVTAFIFAGAFCMAICFLLPPLVPVASGVLNIIYSAIKYTVLFFARAPAISIT